MDIPSEWRLKKDRKVYSYSTESELEQIREIRLREIRKTLLCRSCKKADQGIDHFVSGSSKVAQKE